MVVGVPVQPRRLFGVAVDGGDEAGRHTWVCRAHPGADGVRVESLDRLSDLPGGGVDPRAAARALVAKIMEAPLSAWGFAAPFGKAEAGVRLTDADQNAADLQIRAAGAELMAAVLDPLRGQGSIVVLPLDPLPYLPAGAPAAMKARIPSTYLLEVGPRRLVAALASDLTSPAPVACGDPATREAILRWLVAAAQLRPLARALRTQAAADPNALNAVLSAVAVWRGYRQHDHAALHADSVYRTEGFCYH